MYFRTPRRSGRDKARATSAVIFFFISTKGQSNAQEIKTTVLDEEQEGSVTAIVSIFDVLCTERIEV